MTMNVHDIPGDHEILMTFEEIASSAATNYIAVARVPFICTVTAVAVICSDAVTGANTNTVHLNLDSLAAGTEIANIDLVSGTDLTAGVASALTLGTLANRQLAAGAVLRLEQEEIGTGLGSAIAHGVVVVTIQAR